MARPSHRPAELDPHDVRIGIDPEHRSGENVLDAPGHLFLGSCGNHRGRHLLGHLPGKAGARKDRESPEQRRRQKLLVDLGNGHQGAQFDPLGSADDHGIRRYGGQSRPDHPPHHLRRDHEEEKPLARDCLLKGVGEGKPGGEQDAGEKRAVDAGRGHLADELRLIGP